MNINVDAFYFINGGLSNPLFDAIMPPLSNCGGVVSLAILCLIALILTRFNVFNLGKYHKLVKYCIASLILCVGITAVLKYFISLPRPSLVLDHVNTLTSSVDPYSFPSGHTACSLSVVSVLIIKSREYFRHYNAIACLLIVFSFAIAFSRIYIGMHFPLDVIVGSLVGIISGILVSRFLKI